MYQKREWILRLATQNDFERGLDSKRLCPFVLVTLFTLLIQRNMWFSALNLDHSIRLMTEIYAHNWRHLTKDNLESPSWDKSLLASGSISLLSKHLRPIFFTETRSTVTNPYGLLDKIWSTRGRVRGWVQHNIPYSTVPVKKPRFDFDFVRNVTC